MQKIEAMDFLQGTIVLGFSAVLDYGIKELCAKLPENCLLILCEADKNLREFSENNLCENRKLMDEGFLVFLSENEIYDLPVILQKNSYTFECGKTVDFAGNFRRVIRLDFSAGVQFHEDFYRTLENACVQSVKQFWTNRITLSKFGRKYSLNMFRNLKRLPETTPLKNFISTVDVPVYVFGAGESAEEGVKELKLLQLQNPSKKQAYILCADTAFSMLKSYGVIPDGIVIDEAQSVIAQSFIGVKKYTEQGNNIQVFQSLCSLPHVAGRKFSDKNISFYATEYASNSFFSGLKKNEFFPTVVPAFGSVGITAYILACLFRKNASIPVKAFGLDFAYSAGKTHARGTPAHKRQLFNGSRLKGLDNLGACFGSNVLKFNSGTPYPFTTPVLAGYAETFRQVKEQESSIVSSIIHEYEDKTSDISFEKYFEMERNALMDLRDLLSGKTLCPEEERKVRIKGLMENRQYLYLHFPDGYKMSLEINFLKRVRSEIDGFLNKAL